MKGQPYLRKKGKKWIIEKIVEGKTKYIMTLPPLQEIINRHSKSKQIPSRINTQTKNKGTVNNHSENFMIKNLRLELKKFLKDYLMEVGKKKRYTEIDKEIINKNYTIMKKIERIIK